MVSTTSHDPATGAPVDLELSADSIYAHTLLRLIATSPEPFRLRLSGARTLDVEQGHRVEGGALEAVPADGGHRLRVRLIGWIHERPAGETNAPGPQHRYGMRFYPFVSSHLRGVIETENASIDHVVLDVPDQFRVIWWHQAVRGDAAEGGSDGAELQHSHGEDRSQFVFLWPESRPRSRIVLDVPLRLGAATLGELVLYPALYLALSLFGIALAALAASTSVVVAAIGTTWTFTLRQWTSARLPQQSTLLTAGYILASVFVLAWGLSWEALRWPAAFLVVPLVGSLFYLRHAVKLFREQGTLPRRLTRAWSWYIAKRVARDRAAAQN